MDIRKIKKLIEMLQESDLKEIEVSQGDESVRILRSGLNETGANKVIQQTEVYSATICCNWLGISATVIPPARSKQSGY